MSHLIASSESYYQNAILSKKIRHNFFVRAIPVGQSIHLGHYFLQKQKNAKTTSNI